MWFILGVAAVVILGLLFVVATLLDPAPVRTGVAVTIVLLMVCVTIINVGVMVVHGRHHRGVVRSDMG